MKITSVQIDKKPVREDSRMRATASVLLDDCFMVRYIRVIEGDNGLFIAMPSKKIEVNGETIFKDIAHPINSETRKIFEDAILEAYNKAE